MAVVGVTTLRPWASSILHAEMQTNSPSFENFCRNQECSNRVLHTLPYQPNEVLQAKFMRAKHIRKTEGIFIFFPPPPQNFFIVKVISCFRKFAEIEDVS